MKQFFERNKKWIIMSMFLLVFLTACVNVRDANGKVMLDKLIYLKTGYLDCIGEGWFNIIVWPVAQLINVIGQATDAGIGIIVVTLLLNLGTAAMSIKQQVMSQKMQMIQPEMQKVQAKYAGKTDQASRMRQAQEMQAMYAKYNIKPFGSMLVMFIQLPIILAVYQAVMRAEVVSHPASPYSTFLGVNLLETPMAGLQRFDLAVIAIFLLMVVCQFLSMKIPQILQKRRKEKSKVKTKEYANPKTKGNGMMGNMNTMMYVSLGMITIFSLQWPLGMSFYWLVSAFTRILQNVIIDKYFIKDL